MRLIRYGGESLALQEGHHVLLAPAVAALEPEHPRRRFVAMMYVYALEVEDRLEPPPYTDARAEAYARRALMPKADFLRRLQLPDHRLAEAFNVPLEQVAVRRAELASPSA
jgi:hypothetical protein